MLNKESNGSKNTSTIKFIGVSFESTNYKAGQDELNETISQGYRIMKEYQTSCGVVFSLRKMDNYEISPEQKLMDNYCVDSTPRGLQ